MDEPAYDLLAAKLASELPAILPRQRWYGDKNLAIARCELLDAIELAAAGKERLVLALAGVRFKNTQRATYLCPMRILDGGEMDLETALDRAEMQSALISASAESRRIRGRSGTAIFAAGPRHGHWLSELAAGFRGRLSRAEQSNSSVIFSSPEGAERLVLKCFRRLAPGVNPDCEISEFLSERTAFAATPLFAGSAVYQPDSGGDAWTLAIWQQYVANRGDGWSYLIEALAAGDSAAEVLPQLHALGTTTADLHLALASGGEPAFAPEPIAAADLARWRGDLGQWVGRLAPDLKRAAGELPAGDGALARQVLLRLAALPGLAADLEPLAGLRKIRIHGDYHLGQVLRTTRDDWAIFDFEGEPARPLPERRRKHAALKDVAGMLRSLDYLAFAAGRARAAAARPALDAPWRGAARQAFWSGYRDRLQAAPGDPGLLPRASGAAERALAFFETEKAVYEIAYELSHRPDWLPIPLAGLARLLGVTPAE